MVKKLKQAWKRDPIAVLGVCAAALAFLLWAMPSPSFGISLSQYRCENGASGGSAYSLIAVQVISGCLDNRYDQIIGAEGWFTLERLPAIVSFLALGALLFYVSVRRRGRAKRIARSRAPRNLAVAIVSAAVSALVVTGAGLLLVNQVPSKTVFQTIYRDPTPTPSLQFFSPNTPPPTMSTSPSPEPKPANTPSPRATPSLDSCASFERFQTSAELSYRGIQSDLVPFYGNYFTFGSLGFSACPVEGGTLFLSWNAAYLVNVWDRPEFIQMENLPWRVSCTYKLKAGQYEMVSGIYSKSRWDFQYNVVSIEDIYFVGRFYQGLQLCP
jgi:hypothetical protein